MRGDVEELAALVIDCGLAIHKEIGAGLLESAYEAVLAETLVRKGLKVDRQLPIDIVFRDIVVPQAFRADLVVNNRLLLEIRSVEHLSPMHAKQVLTYLRLMKLPLGLLLNFGGATFREGIKRVVNGHTDLASSRLRVNQSTSKV